MRKNTITSIINIWLIFALLLMGQIFIMSSRNGTLSTNDSYSVGIRIGRIFIRDFDDLTYDEQISFAAAIDHPVRKAAHAAEYTLLGALVFLWLYTARKHACSFSGFLKSFARLPLPLSAFIISALYAVSDEIHQLFVPGRSGQASDVMIDCAGVLLGVLLTFLVTGLIGKCIAGARKAEAKAE